MGNKTKKILLVDDDEELCEEMAGILEEEGYQVTTAFEGLQGKKLIENNTYDLVLLDIKMPGLNGLELLKHAKQIQSPSKFVLITGGVAADAATHTIKVAVPEHEQELVKLADGIIGKPFDVVIVLEKIKQLLGS